MIAARNGWTVGLDNLSWMTAEWSDTLCMLSTGIASGTRAHYTNDEEHVYAVRRPVLFNGMPGDLTARSDLASRTIKLQIAASANHRAQNRSRSERGIRARVAGSVWCAYLMDWSAHCMDWRAIKVAEPERLMDFERFAEAGCPRYGLCRVGIS